MFRSIVALLVPTLFIVAHAFAQDEFSLGVRTTPHLSPVDEQKAFKLPPGFEIQLVAAEPEILKPLNMAFDGKGRLWITDSVEYPYAAPLDKPGRDSIKILEDTDNDGKADKITTFVDGLNIPIGLIPYGDGVIAHSIPNIWFFHDTDGDGKCDTREVLYGPFDHTRDTHGMENAFRRGFDGWIYSCHGFNNNSMVKGKDGNEVRMSSGNTFRFRPDGSRIEHYTFGQVNPFGMCFDPLFNIFTADCHSKPITQLVRGGSYPSFGKPHTGLGFIPSMMEHSHGSTAICGLVHVDGENFPNEWRGHLLSGNVMTSRINHNQLVATGGTLRCKESPDFLSTTDPWFRPVDLQIGPDGALYIADFYNRIIGHYEVPLPHPGRDRTSGRVWRVVYKGDAKESKPAERQKDLTTASDDELIAELGHSVLTRRLLAADLLYDRFVGKDADPTKRAEAAAKGIAKLETADNRSKSAFQVVHLRWLEERLAQCIPSFTSPVNPFFNVDPFAPPSIPRQDNRFIHLHELRMRAAFAKSEPEREVLADLDLADQDGEVARAAAEAVRGSAQVTSIKPLLAALVKTPSEDFLLRQTIRLALKDCLDRAGENGKIPYAELDKKQANELASVALACTTPSSVSFLMDHLQTADESQEQQLAYITHVTRYAGEQDVPRLSELVRKRGAGDLDLQLQSLLALQQGLAQRGASIDGLKPWGEELGKKILESTDSDPVAWANSPLPGMTDTESPWSLQQRACQDGKSDQVFYSSLLKGERKTGLYRSQAFPLPAKLSFWCAGHVGPTGQPPLDTNYIRLRDAETNALLMEARPPRNDTAQRTEWDLGKFAGKNGYIELIDGDVGAGFAWLAVGRFSLDNLNPNPALHRRQAVAQLAAQLQLKSLRPQLAAVVTSSSTDPVIRSSMGAALLALEPDARTAALVRLLEERNLDDAFRVRVGRAIVDRQDADTASALVDGFKIAPAKTQTAAAESLAGDATGAELLLRMVTDGKASAALLRSPNIQQKLAGLKSPDLDRRLRELTAKLPPANEVLDKLIIQRRDDYLRAQPSAEKGVAVFTKHCAACHQIAGKGAVVGPQLDGIGNRGLDRLLEDVLDPNRNVDVAFRTSTLHLADGRVIQGLVRGEEGEQLIVIDNQGKEQRLNKKDVEERIPSAVSLMPANVPEIVPPEDLQNLTAYLLQQRAKVEKP